MEWVAEDRLVIPEAEGRSETVAPVEDTETDDSVSEAEVTVVPELDSNTDESAAVLPGEVDGAADVVKFAASEVPTVTKLRLLARALIE